MSTDQLTKFKALLDSQHQWPSDYQFKFILKKDSLSQIEAIFSTEVLQVRESGKGTYVSVTITKVMASSDEVIAIYEKAATIAGVIAL